MQKIVLGLLLIFLSIGVFGAKLTVNAPNVVSVGERFQISFTVDARVDKFIPPAITGFKVIAGPVSSSSTQIINGVRSDRQTFTFLVEALQEGVVTVPEAEAIVEGASVKSKALSIEIVKGDKPQQQNQSQGQQSQQGQQSTQGAEDSEIFVRMEVSRPSLYKGESFMASIKLYVRGYGVAELRDFKIPQLTGLYAQDMEVPANEAQFHRENVGGKIYNTAVLKRWVLFPQRTGKIAIDPAELTVVLQVPRARQQARSIFDDFFASPYETVDKVLKSSPVSMNIKEFPAGAPSSFTGAVGNFKISAAVDKTEATANQAISYSLTISGSGNLKLVDEPVTNFPADFDKYDPKVSENIKTTGSGSSGSKKYEYAVIPRSAGNFEIPGTEFTYFDPAKGSYVTLTTDKLELTVQKDPYGNTAPVGPIQAVNQQDIRHLGNDIRFIKTEPLSLQPAAYVFFSSGLFWLINFLGLVVFILIVVVMRKRIKDRSDQALMRNKRANKVALQRLKLSSKLIKDQNKDGFYEELSRATWGYVSDKLNIPGAELSRDNVQEQLQTRGVSQEIINLLIQVIDHCEFARYSPESKGEMEQVYNNAIEVISKLEKGA